MLTQTRRLRVYRKSELRRDHRRHGLQVTEETFGGVQIMPQERVQNRTVEQFVDVPVPQS